MLCRPCKRSEKPVRSQCLAPLASRRRFARSLGPERSEHGHPSQPNPRWPNRHRGAGRGLALVPRAPDGAVHSPGGRCEVLDRVFLSVCRFPATARGSARRRLPVAAKMALPTAGAIPTMGVSPAPAEVKLARREGNSHEPASVFLERIRHGKPQQSVVQSSGRRAGAPPGKRPPYV
jgi:hypothetical protein